jgi:hypothetical protein
MRRLLFLLLFMAGTAWSQPPDSGIFRYELFDSGHRKVSPLSELRGLCSYLI